MGLAPSGYQPGTRPEPASAEPARGSIRSRGIAVAMSSGRSSVVSVSGTPPSGTPRSMPPPPRDPLDPLLLRPSAETASSRSFAPIGRTPPNRPPGGNASGQEQPNTDGRGYSSVTEKPRDARLLGPFVYWAPSSLRTPGAAPAPDLAVTGDEPTGYAVAGHPNGGPAQADTPRRLTVDPGSRANCLDIGIPRGVRWRRELFHLFKCLQ